MSIEKDEPVNLPENEPLEKKDDEENKPQVPTFKDLLAAAPPPVPIISTWTTVESEPELESQLTERGYGFEILKERVYRAGRSSMSTDSENADITKQLNAVVQLANENKATVQALQSEIRGDVGRLTERFNTVDEKFNTLNQSIQTNTQSTDRVELNLNEKISKLETNLKELFASSSKTLEAKIDGFGGQIASSKQTLEAKIEGVGGRLKLIWPLIILLLTANGGAAFYSTAQVNTVKDEIRTLKTESESRQQQLDRIESLLNKRSPSNP